ncbi:bifunctional phosphoribosylaminoimidazolecarboxamide formyltransferase/IMP cyclohydrolase [Candidatus Woesearchaeota archaeon]|nr:bifunctional phosphoribosylaminoimidazolecarboxamide formyltransferase/IMP cyclohydrolase [Candidatus Woesearchaeota archaeon]
MKNAIISVYNKEGIGEFARELANLGIKIISSGGTAKKLRDEGIKVQEVSEYTKSPEIMDGRVKTLHPKVHAGILADRDNPEHMKQLAQVGAETIDIVVVNFYPFEETVKHNPTFDEAVENIDIGGPSMVRAAAKNHKHVLVVVDPNDYEGIITAIRSGKIDDKLKQKLALKAFEHTARYDSIINNYFREQFSGDLFPETLNLTFKKRQNLRYGENPHQKAAFYEDPIIFESGLGTMKQLWGKELSFNNILDIDNAFDLVKNFDRPAATVVKHTNPAGCSIADTIDEAFEKAYAADSLSAFGGVVALNRPCTKKIAESIGKVFMEIVICPKFEDGAFKVLKSKKNIRLLETGSVDVSEKGYYLKKVVGGVLVQSRDRPKISVKGLKIVTKRKPTADEMEQMLFAFYVTRHVKSNSIVYVKGNVTVGIGAGQMSRVDSVKIANEKAGRKAKGAVMSSDAFFPFRDGIDEAAKAGIKAVIQPGGSIKDEEVIKAADEHGMAMVFTGIRLFWH